MSIGKTASTHPKTQNSDRLTDTDSEKRMTQNSTKATAAQKSVQTTEKKWGKKVVALGFCIVPSLLLKAQRRIGLNPSQLAVLLQLLDHWWESERRPYPGKKLLADRLGISPRQVQRHIADLEQAGLVRRTPRVGSHGGKLSNEYDLTGLVRRLQQLEPEFRKVEESATAEKKAVSLPGYSLSKE